MTKSDRNLPLGAQPQGEINPTASPREKEVEKMVKAAGADAPRITPELINSKIVHEQFHVFFGTTTVCALKLANGFTVIGKSGVVSPENFREEIGKNIARYKAREQIGELEGYLLAETLRQNVLKDDKEFLKTDTAGDPK